MSRSLPRSVPSAATPILVALLGAAAPAVARAQSAPPAAPLAIPVTFFGEVRTRSEMDRPRGALDADAFTYLRTRFGVRVDASPNARVVVQLQDSRVLGAEGNTSATAPDRFDLHQGYLELTTLRRGLTLSARAGRQEIALANERLIGAVNWSNTGRSFDGVRLAMAPAAGGWSATAFAATMEEMGRRFGTGASAGRAPDHAVAGLSLARGRADGPSASALLLDASAVYDRGARFRAYDRADRTTLHARLRAPSLFGARAELEAAYQFGVQRYAPAADTAAAHGQTVSAALVAARLGTPANRRVTAAVGADWLSGASDPRGGRYGAFATLYATNHQYYGLMDVVGDPSATTAERGLLDALATASVALTRATTLKGELHRLAPAAGDRAPLGWEGDLVLPMRLSPVAGVELGYALFRAGRGAAPLGLGAKGATRDWGYLQMRVGF